MSMEIGWWRMERDKERAREIKYKAYLEKDRRTQQTLEFIGILMPLLVAITSAYSVYLILS